MNAHVEGGKARPMSMYSTWKLRMVQSHGRMRGFANHLASRALCFAGAYRRYEKVDWPQIRRLIFICKGNICRSAYGEAYARSLRLETISRGLEAEEGKPSDQAVAAASRSRGVDLSSHLSAPFHWSEVRAGDLLIVMEPGQARRLRDSGSEPGAQITLLGLWSRPRRPYLQDPLGLNAEYVETCLTILDSAVRNIANQMKNCNGK